MKNLFRFLLLIPIFATCHCVTLAQSQGPLLLENPTISRTKIAFSYAGDIWLVDRNGGTAQRLTTTPQREIYPTFSPDGSQVAFARLNPAVGPSAWDVFVAPVSGGEERRVTYHPDFDFPVNWTPDGKRILIFSFRHRTSLALVGGLYTIPAQGGFASEVPVPRGWRGSFSPAGDRIAYTPLSDFNEIVGWRNYRGGGTGRIWLVKLSDASTEVIPRNNSHDSHPMWVGDKVYFVSNRTGTENLFSYDTVRKTIAQITHFEKYGIKSASTNGELIVFNQGGAIHLFNPQANKSTSIDVRISAEFPQLKPRKINATGTNSAALSPDAKHLLLGIRGEIFNANTATGEVANITKTGRAVEHNFVWSPDGKWIAYFSDESGEMELHLQTAPAGTVRRIPIEKKSSFYRELQWSPDSRKLVFSDSHLALWCFDLDKNAASRLDNARHTDGDPSFQPSWSPDSKWLTYSKYGFNRVRSIVLYSFDTGKLTTITSPHIDAQQPLFDNNGKYLYFVGSDRTGLVESQSMAGFPFRGQVTRNLYAVALNSMDRSPLSVDEKAAATKANRVVIDLEQISDRVLIMPFWPATASRIMAGKPGTLFIVDGGALHKFVNGKSGLEKFVEGAGFFRITGDGAHLALRRQGVWSIVSTDVPPKPEDGRLKLNPIELTTDPREEWKQMFGEAWRRMREHFYDPNLHGQNIAELQAHYAAYLPNISSREDLNLLFNEMFAHLSVSHLYVSGGDVVVAPGIEETVGLLGADIEIDNGRYRVKRILRGDNTRQIYSPLAMPGVNVKVGEYILAVDGADISADQSFYRYFLNKATKAISLKVATNADGKDARTVRVVPLLTEANLRHYDWVEGNRLRVAQMSAGKLGYIYLPDTATAGYNAFNREFYAQLDKQGLIVDGRFNQGGRAADYIMDTLRRIPFQRAQLRDADDIRIPTGMIHGPKVLLTNESAGSGGDSLPWMWQQSKIGPVVGTRTSGAGIGASDFALIDGGSFRVPDWGWYDPSTGTWFMENRGITPDYELEIMPPAWRAGRDPQLEKAVELAMDALKRMKPLPSKRPSYPVYK
ncbi:MAG TPA: PDZ domain-containing protein [Pyrinomonadaceae bacterium]|nr:PDZ domain-containing protein [Pyrinomonadaceae bacterium]